MGNTTLKERYSGGESLATLRPIWTGLGIESKTFGSNSVCFTTELTYSYKLLIQNTCKLLKHRERIVKIIECTQNLQIILYHRAVHAISGYYPSSAALLSISLEDII